MPPGVSVDLTVQSFPLRLRLPQRCAICGKRLPAGQNAWAVKALGVPNFYCSLGHLRRGKAYWKDQRDRVARNQELLLESQLQLPLEKGRR